MAAHSLLDSSVTLWWMSVCSVMNDSTGSPLLPLTLFVTLSCDAGNQWKHNPEFFLEWETNWLVVLVGSETLRPIIRFLDCGKPESVFFFLSNFPPLFSKKFWASCSLRHLERLWHVLSWCLCQELNCVSFNLIRSFHPQSGESN